MSPEESKVRYQVPETTPVEIDIRNLQHYQQAEAALLSYCGNTLDQEGLRVGQYIREENEHKLFCLVLTNDNWVNAYIEITKDDRGNFNVAWIWEDEEGRRNFLGIYYDHPYSDRVYQFCRELFYTVK